MTSDRRVTWNLSVRFPVPLGWLRLCRRGSYSPSTLLRRAQPLDPELPVLAALDELGTKGMFRRECVILQGILPGSAWLLPLH